MLLKVTCGDRETKVVKAPDIGISIGEYIIYKTESGKDIGCVIEKLPQSHVVSYRFASTSTQEDVKRMKDLEKEEAEKMKECTEILPTYNLQMKFIECHIQFDRKKMKFYFLADTKLDYRPLIKHLSKKWNIKMEFQQIGARDYAKCFPEYGLCGKQTCCSQFRNNFDSIPTTLLRLQNLACGTDKATGICGKLMCCLKYEENFYRKQEKEFPAIGSLVSTNKGEGTIIDRNFITDTVIIKYPNGKKLQISRKEIEPVSKPPMLILGKTFLGRR